METHEKNDIARIARLRRTANRRGFHLTKSRRRDPGALDYQGWFITDLETGARLTPKHGLTLDEVEKWLGGRDQ